jgi:hypothetical protein
MGVDVVFGGVAGMGVGVVGGYCRIDLICHIILS